MEDPALADVVTPATPPPTAPPPSPPPDRAKYDVSGRTLLLADTAPLRGEREPSCLPAAFPPLASRRPEGDPAAALEGGVAREALRAECLWSGALCRRWASSRSRLWPRGGERERPAEDAAEDE